MEDSGKHAAILERRNAQQEQQDRSEQETQGKEQVSANALYRVLSVFDHARDFTREDIKQMIATLSADLEEVRFPQVNLDHFKRDQKEYKEAKITYLEQAEKYRDYLRSIDDSLPAISEYPWPVEVLEPTEEELSSLSAADQQKRLDTYQERLAAQQKKEPFSRDEKVSYFQELIADELDSMRVSPEKSTPIVPQEYLQAGELVNFVYQNALGNTGIDLNEVVSDKFNRLKENLPLTEGGAPDPEELEILNAERELLTPNLVLLAKLQLELKKKTDQSGREVLPPDSKLNKDAIKNLDPVALVFQLKSMPNVNSAADMLSWGYTAREALFLYQFSQVSSSILDPDGTGQINFDLLGEDGEGAQPLHDEVEKVYPSSTHIVDQKRAMMRRAVKYLTNEEMLFSGKTPADIGLDENSFVEEQADRDARFINLIQTNLYEDTALEPKETLLATRNFREGDLQELLSSLLRIKREASTEGREKHATQVVKFIANHYELFSLIHKDEVGMPELYDDIFRKQEAQKVLDNMFTLIKVATGVTDFSKSFRDEVSKYINIQIDLDHNASLRRSILKKGDAESRRLRAPLIERVSQLKKGFEKDLGEWAGEVNDQRQEDEEIANAIGSLRYESGRLKQLKQSPPKGKALRKAMEELRDTEIETPVINDLQKQFDTILSDRTELLKTKRKIEEKLGITA